MLAMDDKMVKVWNELASELEENNFRLVLFTTSIHPEMIFDYVQIPFTLDEFEELSIDIEKDELTEGEIVDEFGKREIEWFGKGEDYLNKYKTGYTKCVKYYKNILQSLKPSIVLVWQNSLPQSNILKRLSEEFLIPSYILERGMLPNTFMLESTGNVALSDIVNNLSLRKKIIAHSIQDNFNTVKEFYISEKPSKYNQISSEESEKKLEEFNFDKKPLLVFFANIDSSVGAYPEGTALSQKTNIAYNNTCSMIEALTQEANKQKFNLIVKLHPQERNDFNHLVGKRVKIEKNFNYQFLMQNSDVMAFAATTLQFEALLYEKPILLFSNTELRGFNIAYEVNSQNELDVIINSTLKKEGFEEKLANAKRYIDWVSKYFLYAFLGETPIKNNLFDMARYLCEIGIKENLNSYEDKKEGLNQFLLQINYKHENSFNLPKNSETIDELDLEINSQFEKYLLEKSYFEAYRLVETNLRNNPSSKELNAFQNELFERISKRKLEKNWDVNKSVRALQNAEKYFNSGKLDDAKNKLMEVLNLEPQHIEAINDLSVWALTQNQNEYAIDLIKYVLGFEKGNEDALRNKEYMIENGLWLVEEIDEYKEKIDQELNIYRNQLKVHELPNAHHIYTGKFLQNAVEKLTGARNFNSWCASEIDKLASELGRKIYGISIGCGNGDTELEIMKQIKNKDLVHFTGLDINQTMVERGNKSLKESNIFNMEYKVGDFNYPKFEKKYDFFFANHSLHHVTELENLFSAIAENSNENMIFLINDMIGRNGHVLWDGTKEAVQMIWNNLDEKYKYNAYSKEYDQEVMDHDCSSEGFEGIRAEDIVPLLNKYFDFDTYLPFSFIISRFIDRAYGHNYNVESNQDIQVINKIIDLEIKATQENKFSATQAFIKLKNKNSVEKLKFLFQTPEETIKNRKNRNYFLEEDCKL